MDKTKSAQTGSTGNWNRRELLRTSATLGALSVLGMSRRALADMSPTDRLDPEKARSEGPLLIVHGDQEPDILALLDAFYKKTGISAQQQHMLAGTALPKFMAEAKANRLETDIYMGTDPVLFEPLLAEYESSELSAYPPEYYSPKPVYWAAYHNNIGPIMYDPAHVNPADAPKNWLDLLDPKWKGQIGFQNASAGNMYAFWYLIKDRLPADYWDRLAEQEPRAYESSTQILADMRNGDLLIGGAMSLLQYVKAQRAHAPLNAVFPPEGTTSTTEVITILKDSKRPNASRMFVDYLLSEEGQKFWSEIHGTAPARQGVHIDELPDLTSHKILVPTDMEDYSSKENHVEFVRVWNKVTGF